MLEQKIEIKKAFMVNAFCEKCNEPLVRTNIVLTSDPPQFRYYCKKCNEYSISRNQYPQIVYEYDLPSQE